MKRVSSLANTNIFPSKTNGISFWFLVLLFHQLLMEMIFHSLKISVDLNFETHFIQTSFIFCSFRLQEKSGFLFCHLQPSIFLLLQ